MYVRFSLWPLVLYYVTQIPTSGRLSLYLKLEKGCRSGRD